MAYVVACLRVLVATLAGYGAYRYWHFEPTRWDTFTLSAAILLAVVSMMGAWSVFARRQLPRPTLELGAVVFALVGGVIHEFTVGDKWGYPAIIGPVSASDLIHLWAPALALLGWLLCSPHRVQHFSTLLVFAAVPAAYVGLVLARGMVMSRAGFVYPFLDPTSVGWRDWGTNAALFVALFAVAGLVLVILDRVLPERSPLTAGQYVVP